MFIITKSNEQFLNASHVVVEAITVWITVCAL
jgi:hypothetical protein